MICHCGEPMSEGTQRSADYGAVEVWACHECGEVQPREDDAPEAWRATLEQHAPELLDDLMHMSSIALGAHEIHYFKHTVTRRYLNLDASGQAWRIAVDEDGNTIARPIDLAAAKAYATAQPRGRRDT